MTALLCALGYVLLYAPIVLFPRRENDVIAHRIPQPLSAGDTVRSGSVVRPVYVPPDAPEALAEAAQAHAR